MKKKIIAAAAFALSSGLAQAQGTDKEGWYGGLDLGYTKLGLSSGDVDGALAVSGASHSGTNLLYGAGLRYDFDGGYFTKLGWDRYQNVGDAGSTGKGSIDSYQLGVDMHF